MPDPIDISVRLHPEMPTWPGSVGYQRRLAQSIITGGIANVSTIEMDVHCGTHIEAPMHFIDGGAPVETIPIDTLVGPAWVVELAAVDRIDAESLEAAVPPGEVRRLLLRTRNSELWAAQAAFATDYVALTRDGAEWVARRGVRLIGVDYLSVQRFGDDPETHRVLMRANVAILEGLDLSHAPPGHYRLTCLPMYLADAEAAPARAILEPSS